MKNNERVQLEKQINNMETLGYISLNAHNEQYITSKKDDFESAGYIMLYLLNYL